uniref:SNF7 family protein n=1 Tax=Trepomonas sp. PC1 TaxID=1076344 RepID=A0A146K7K6_9EUKA|eukprot:JAP92830.1 SNF7 family protein [Trepomonas sp. PC1]
MDDFIFNMRFQGKMFRRESDKALKDFKKYQEKAKVQLMKNNAEAAQIYAQQAVQYKQYSAQYVQMACKFDIICGNLKTQQLNSQTVGEIAKLNDVVQQNLQPSEMINQAKVMTQFNMVCEKMGVQQSVVQNMMGETDQQVGVSDLMRQLEDEIATKDVGQVKDVQQIEEPVAVVQNQKRNELDDLASKLAML